MVYARLGDAMERLLFGDLGCEIDEREVTPLEEALSEAREVYETDYERDIEEFYE